MRAQELRILNNVLDIEGKVCQVMRVHAKGVVGLSAVDGSYKWESFSLQDDVKPIPLTEEWLERFGFVYKNGYGYKFKYGWISRKDKYWSYYSLMIKIYYVHQLQNLYFALTAEELTIKEGEQSPD